MDLSFFLLAIPVVLLTGISKGGFAGGLGTLAVPLLALMIDPRQAAAIMLPILCLMDLFGAWAYRHQWDATNLKLLLPGAIFGIVCGALTFHLMNADFIRIMVGALSIYFVAHYWYSMRAHQNTGKTLPNRMKGGFWGAVSGFSSFIAHAGGPPLSIYLFPQKMDKTLLVGTSVMFFISVNYLKLIPYAWLGQLNLTNLGVSLLLLPLAPIGVKLGIWMHTRIHKNTFYLICYGLLLIAGIKLLVEGLAAIIAR